MPFPRCYLNITCLYLNNTNVTIDGYSIPSLKVLIVRECKLYDCSGIESLTLIDCRMPNYIWTNAKEIYCLGHNNLY